MRVTVSFAVLPPVIETGLAAIFSTSSVRTLMVVCTSFPLRDAFRTTGVRVATALVVQTNVAVVAFALTESVVGQTNACELLERKSVPPAAGIAPVNVTVTVTGFPPATGDGSALIALIVGR